MGKETIEQELLLHSTGIPHSQRMVLVSVFADLDGNPTSHRIDPVIGLVHRIVDEYKKEVDRDTALEEASQEFSSHVELTAAGYTRAQRQDRICAVVFTGNCLTFEPDTKFDPLHRRFHRLFRCTWSEHEDETVLKPEIDKMHARLQKTINQLGGVVRDYWLRMYNSLDEQERPSE